MIFVIILEILLYNTTVLFIDNHYILYIHSAIRKMNIFHENENNDKCTAISNHEHEHNNYTRKRKFSNFNINLNLKNPFVLFFTLSIIITSPFGILSQIQIQTTEALHPSVINDNISGMRDKSNSNGNSNSNSNDDNSMDNNNINEIVIVPDDKPGTELSPTETTGLQIDAQSSINSYRDHVNSNANENAKQNVVVSQDKSSSESSSSVAASSQSLSAQSSNEVYADFNGDGFDDIAIGASGESFDSGAGTLVRAGAVNVIYGSSNGLSATSPRPDQIWTQDTADVNDMAEELDNWGQHLAAGDFNGDGRDDLAIGVPLEDLDPTKVKFNEGAVNVIYGSSNGLSATSPRPDQFWTQDTAGVDDGTEERDFFGSSVSSGDFNGDGRDDLAIGAPGENVDTTGVIVNEGAVHVLYGSSSGLSTSSPRTDQLWSQATPGVDDVAEEQDGFGFPLSSGDFNGDGKDDLAIGVSGEDVVTGAGTQTDAGAVNVLYGSSSGLSATTPRPDQFWTQSTTDVNDLAETDDDFGNSLSSGDFNGDGRDDLAIGVPEEDVVTGAGTQTDAGAVNVLYGSSSGLSATSPRPDQFWTQSTTDVNDLAEMDDQFGFSLSSGDFNGDGRDDLAIGVPEEDVVIGASNIIGAGAVNVLYSSSNGLSATSPRPDQIWTQSTEGVNDVAELGDDFGESLSSGDFNGDGRGDLAIGVPEEDVVTGAGNQVGAGAVNVLYGSSSGLSATSPRPDQIWTQSTPDVNDVSEISDSFGDSLA